MEDRVYMENLLSLLPNFYMVNVPMHCAWRMVLKSAKKCPKSQKCPKVPKVPKRAGPVNYNYPKVPKESKNKYMGGLFTSFITTLCYIILV